MHMKEEIEKRLVCLVGKRFSDMMRYAGWQRFEFGEQKPTINRKGRSLRTSDLAIAAACHWRITQNGNPVVSADDFGPDRERRDDSAMPFYAALPDKGPIIERLTVGERGELLFVCSDGISLEIDATRPLHTWLWENENALWRFLSGDKNDWGLVLTTDGIERYDTPKPPTAPKYRPSAHYNARMLERLRKPPRPTWRRTKTKRRA